MDALWHDITYVMDCERRLVGNDRLRNAFLVSAPKGPTDQVFALTRRKVTQAKDATMDSYPVTATAVIVLLAIRIAGLSRLGSSKIAALPGSDLVKLLCVLLRVSHYL
jgi:hypothetical protein